MLQSIATSQNEFLLSQVAEKRKKLGQFFTDSKIAQYMASLFDGKNLIDHIDVLDAGAGAGILSIATVQRMKALGFKNVALTAYEIDPDVISLLEENLKSTAYEINNNAFTFTYEIIEKDFILDKSVKKYDVCCINPPYFKYSAKDSPYTKATAHLFKGDPNIYASFVAKALEALKPSGELVFITPRSFTNGLYFKDFRKFLSKNSSISFIHIFKSRKDLFKETDVLQENVIIKLVKSVQQINLVPVSTSMGITDLDNSVINFYEKELVLDQTSAEYFIRIPESLEDAENLKLVEDWEDTFTSLGYFISTGPVVEYRSKEFFEDSNCASIPLINAHNLYGLNVVWDGTHKKDKRFYLINGYEKWTVKNSTYVLIKRISSKDDKKRINTAIYEPASAQQNEVAFENHINFIGHKERALTKDEAYGLTLILRSNLFDSYFRSISGNTQVNATEIKTLKLPGLNTIEKIGNSWLNNKISENEVDKILEKWNINESINAR